MTNDSDESDCEEWFASLEKETRSANESVEQIARDMHEKQEQLDTQGPVLFKQLGDLFESYCTDFNQNRAKDKLVFSWSSEYLFTVRKDAADATLTGLYEPNRMMISRWVAPPQIATTRKSVGSGLSSM
jgi:hypothetical protein